MTREDGFTFDRWQEDGVQKKTRKILEITDLIPSYLLLLTVMLAYTMSRMPSNSLRVKAGVTASHSHLTIGSSRSMVARHDSTFTRVVDPFSGVIDPRRVFGGSSRHDVAIISERGKTVYEIRHRKNIAIDMLLISNKSTRKETTLYYYPTIFAGEKCA
ncbi:unnamed protein product, partial [Aureobasidium pullulans]